MKRQLKTLIYMAIVFSALLALAGIMTVRVQKTPHNLTGFSPENTRNAALFNLSIEEISSIELTAPAHTLLLTPDEAGVWDIRNSDHPTISAAVASLVNTILTLHTVQTLPWQADLAPLGLTDPPMRVEIHLKNQQLLVLYVGFLSPSGQNFYARLSDSPTPLLISATSVDELMRPLSFFINTQLPTIDALSLVNVGVENRYGVFNAQVSEDPRFGSNFMMTRPFPTITMRSDRFDKSFIGLWDLRTPINVLDSYESSPQPLAFYGLDNPLATLKLQDKHGAFFHIAIGKRSSPHSYYAKELNKPAVWALPSDLAEAALNFNPWSMINLDLIRFNPQTLKTLIFRHNNTAYELASTPELGQFVLGTRPINAESFALILKNVFALHYSDTHSSLISDTEALFSLTIINEYGVENWEFFPLTEASTLGVKRNGTSLSLTIALPLLTQLWSSVTSAS